MQTILQPSISEFQSLPANPPPEIHARNTRQNKNTIAALQGFCAPVYGVMAQSSALDDDGRTEIALAQYLCHFLGIFACEKRPDLYAVYAITLC